MLKRINLLLITGALLVAQTGRVYIPTPEERSNARAAYSAVELAKKELEEANKSFTEVKSRIAKAHGLFKTEINFSSDFSTFESPYWCNDRVAGHGCPGPESEIRPDGTRIYPHGVSGGTLSSYDPTYTGPWHN